MSSYEDDVLFPILRDIYWERDFVASLREYSHHAQDGINLECEVDIPETY